MTWLFVTLALIGTVFNVRQDRRGFWFWVVSNSGLAGMNAAKGEWAQALMFAVYSCLAIWGLWSWKR